MKKTIYVYEHKEGLMIERFIPIGLDYFAHANYTFLGTREIEITEPAPEKKREPIEQWVNVYQDGVHGTFDCKSYADDYRHSDRLECVRLVECPEGSSVIDYEKFKKVWLSKFMNDTEDNELFVNFVYLLGIKKAGA